jgi:hypothetical protein
MEHNLEGKSNDIQKQKIIEKIQWLRKKLLEEKISHPYGTKEIEELNELQKANLIAISDQMETLYENRAIKEINNPNRKK